MLIKKHSTLLRLWNVDDNIKIDINDKAKDVENALKSENNEEKSEDVLNENVIQTKDIEKSSQPVQVDNSKKV